MPNTDRWTEALRLHRDAADAYLAAASSLSDEAWSSPIAAGKWTPAQITDHLNRAYDVLLSELRGGSGMAVRTRRWQQWLLRFTIVPRLKRGGWFPAGARAPRETRPVDSLADRQSLLERFRLLAGEFEDEIRSSRAADPRRRVTHAYFGAASLTDGALLCARHLEHHLRQIAALTAA
jgi:hypothetical protein